ncbi:MULTISPECIES: hypothetical protein [Streptococcus]|uniref:Phage protein n=1 Tax=Streptococcus caledonicus TaxID=2614158 RepID=A0ABW0UH35_9STRE|nr:hypothetical protein [Streptococcus sp. S784/96/1]
MTEENKKLTRLDATELITVIKKMTPKYSQFDKLTGLVVLNEHTQDVNFDFVVPREYHEELTEIYRDYNKKIESLCHKIIYDCD